MDSTEDPAHGNQEGMAYNGHFGKNCFHPLFCFTSDGDCLAAKLRPGNVQSANGTLDLIKPIVIRYRKKFKLFWLRGDSAFADSDTYEYCEANRLAGQLIGSGHRIIWVHIIFGYRSPKTNAALRRRNRRVSKKSYHIRGKAIDIRLPKIRTSTVHNVARHLCLGGVGYYPRSRFVHIDTGTVRYWKSNF